MGEKEKATARLDTLVCQLRQVPRLKETDVAEEEVFRREKDILDAVISRLESVFKIVEGVCVKDQTKRARFDQHQV